jgi:two-component system NarL family response regulator
LIADDHAVIRRALTLMLEFEADIDVTGVATNGQEAVTMAKAIRPEVVVLDVKMPLLDGVEAGRKILALLPHTKLLMVSSEDSKAMIEESLHIGASGYIAKHCSLMQVPGAIRQIMEGNTYLCLASSRALTAT